MLRHCLSRNELQSLLWSRTRRGIALTDELEELVAASSCWAAELAGMTYLLVKITDRKELAVTERDSLVATFFLLDETLNFVVEEGGGSFIDYMLGSCRDHTVSLEDQLLSARTGLGNYDFRNITRS